MNDQKMILPVPVLDHPHWRVNIRPGEYQKDLIPSLAACYETIEKTKLSLRGWDYPHLSNRSTERATGANWVSSWSAFWGHFEYWRLYQSGQFIHVFAVREVTEVEWRKKLESDMRNHLSFMKDIDWNTVPGFISIVNFLYNVTEVFEFATRLCQVGLYKGVVTIGIGIKGIKGFVLSMDTNRVWHSYYAAGEDNIANSWSIKGEDLIAESSDYALSAVHWFFERFNWLSFKKELLKQDQENFLKRRI